MKQKTINLLIIGLFISAVGIIIVYQLVVDSRIVIEDYSIDIDRVGVDKLYLDSVNVLLRNEGNASSKIVKIILSLGKSKIEKTLVGSLDPGEERKLFLPTYPPLEKEIGVEQLKGTITVINSSGRILTEKNITVPIPIVKIGDAGWSQHDMSLTLLEWKESDVAVEGPYWGGGYYTFTAKPEMKFIILIYRFQNNSKRPQSTPYLSEGEIVTDKGYIYKVWHSPSGASSKEYKPRNATTEEINTLTGGSGGYEELMPEKKSAKGRIAFEIPKDETPIEASIKGISALIEYQRTE